MTSTHRRDEMRKVFYDAWRKHKEKSLVEPIEAMIIEVILSHPEYHEMFDHPEKISEADIEESNPFLHISLHLAIREQINTDSPKGIQLIYDNLCKKLLDPHAAEHQMLKCLKHILWEAQQTGSLPDEQYYLEVLQRIG